MTDPNGQQPTPEQQQFADLQAQLQALLAEHPELGQQQQAEPQPPQPQPRTFTRAELRTMSDVEYARHRADIVRQMNAGQLR
jgi:plasmid stabilization system protein ParE